MAESEKEIHPGSFVGDTIEEFKKLPRWGKVAIGVILVAVVVVAIYLRSRANASGATVASGAASGSGLSNLAPTDLSGGGAAGPVSPTTTTTPPPAEVATPIFGPVGTGNPITAVAQGFQHVLSGTNAKGLLGSGATVYSSNGQIYATQPGGISALLSSILPAGTKIYGGGQGRWWYQLPGEHQQYLLTSGAGPDVKSGIGTTSAKVPTNAFTVGQSTSSPSTMQAGQLPASH